MLRWKNHLYGEMKFFSKGEKSLNDRSISYSETIKFVVVFLNLFIKSFFMLPSVMMWSIFSRGAIPIVTSLPNLVLSAATTYTSFDNSINLTDHERCIAVAFILNSYTFSPFDLSEYKFYLKNNIAIWEFCVMLILVRG
ncbi:hypothetical protein [Heyndrickxia vini]|uniref:Uncharacterized protein n=1 Tax=Heyndrickxia vini TaxID=1476025 RepID=A0ABX7E3L3_9BACI|nr:hypothetical protein [Heyndrickxia vini]QQZ09402.1 hypothetical protein I5776_21025 [Heyndrickxia vini]